MSTRLPLYIYLLSCLLMDIINVWVCLYFFKSLFYKQVYLISQTYCRDYHAYYDHRQLQLCWSVNSRLCFQGIVESHASVVVGRQQNNKLSHVTQVGSVVLVEVGERQVHDVVHDICEGEGQDDESAKCVLDAGRHVEAQCHAIDDRERNVELVDTVLFELLLELAEVLLFCELEAKQNYEISEHSEHRCQGTELVVLCVCRGSIFEVESGREGDVEAAEQEQSQEYFLQHELAYFLQKCYFGAHKVQN